VSTLAVSLDQALDRLAEFESDAYPVVSLYVDLSSDGTRDSYKSFLNGAIKEQLDSFEEGSAKRQSLERDFEKIRTYLQQQTDSRTQTVAIFACAGDGELFEALQLEAPIDGHRLYVDREPHMFPLARLADQYSGFAVVLVNTNTARIYVVEGGAAQRQLNVRNKKGKRVSAGGWSQARYQRRVENLQTKHMKEVADALEQVVRDDAISRVLVGGDDVALPLLREHLSPQTQEKIVAMSGVDINSADGDLFAAAIDAFRESDEESDKYLVDAMLNAYRSRGLATIGVTGVRSALERGQVDRLLVPATPATAAADNASSGVESAGTKEERSDLDEKVIEALVTLAKRTDAAVTFIEDARLLEPARGVGAMLRYRI
jgi:peptide subunit release factor 1 (eRF1)